MRLFKLDNLVKCSLVDRLNRFTVRVVVGGVVSLAHLTNTGRLGEYLVGGREGFCSVISGSRLNYRLVAVRDVGGYALVDTLTQGRVFEYLLSQGLIPWLGGCSLRKRNFRLVNEVIDYLLDCVDGVRLVELKSAVLRVGGDYASYPDCPTIRGRRQIKTLAEYSSVFKPYVVFMASLPNVKGFKPYCLGDPDMLHVMRYAFEKGVVFKAINSYMNDEGWVVLNDTDLPVIIEC